MLRRIAVVTAATAAALVPAAVVAAPAQAATRPGRITAVTTAPGPHPGEVTIRWKQTGGHTTSFRVETGLTTFGAASATLPDHGRRTRYFSVPGSRRSMTLSAAQVASTGAAVGSGDHLFLRLSAVNTKGPGTAVRPWPYLLSVAPRPVTPAAGTGLRVASFNVRTAHTAAGDGPSWYSRVDRVATTILSRSPGVVTLQELSPGRADGGNGDTAGSPRQTGSLLTALAAHGGGRYALVRQTPYVQPGLPAGTQGARILYDTTKYELLTDCSDWTGGHAYSSSCSMELPVLSDDPLTLQRSTAWAELRDRATGKRFWVVSTHLDNRKSTSLTTQRRYDALRTTQIRAVLAKVAQLDTEHVPVVLGGDLNTWQSDVGGNGAHVALTGAGYYDTADAVTQVGTHWTTFNGFVRTVAPSASGWGARLDVLATHGLRGAVRFENVFSRTDDHRPSDHNMVVADLRLP